jgi:hypothetical protein
LILLDLGGDFTVSRATGFLPLGIPYLEQNIPSLGVLMKPARIPTLIAQAAVPAVLIVLLSYPAGLLAQSPDEHVVSSQTLQQNLETSSATRQANVQTLTKFMSTPTAEKAMRDAKIDPVQVQKAIPTLSDHELADLSARASDTQQKFSAGVLGTSMLTLIIVLIAIIIIVAIIH